MWGSKVVLDSLLRKVSESSEMKAEKLRMPFEVKKIRRRPGQSAGEHWRAIVENGLDSAFLSVILGGTYLGWSLVQRFKVVFPIALGVALFVICISFAVWKFFKVKREVRTWRLGENGEQYVGQTLEKDMRPLNYDVFHDVVIKKDKRTFNLDHVLIGPKGVYVVETKAWRKPEKGSPEIEYKDGHLCKMGHVVKDDAVKEAVSLAREANRLFHDLTGRSYYVKPLLVIAGWFCRCNNLHDSQLAVLNEKQVAAWVQKDTPQRMPDPKDLELLRVKLEQYEV